MKIIIIGNGKVGYSLAEHLSKGANDVTIIDKNPDALKKSIYDQDVMCIRGNGLRAKLLLEAGVSKADLVIAVTDMDEANMVCCLTAKKLGARHTIARIRDPEYADELSLLKEELGLDMVINPEQAAANEIAKLFRFSHAVNFQSYYKGRVNMIGMKVTKNNPIVGMKIYEIAQKYDYPVLIAAVERRHNVIIPNGDFEIAEDDVIHIIGAPQSVFDFSNAISNSFDRIKNTMIIGGSRIAYYLTDAIRGMGVKVKIIEREMDKCLELTELLPGSLIINGDGTDEETLISENLKDMDAFIALTGRDEDNLMTALMAQEYGVSRVIAKITHIKYSFAVKKLGLDTLINPKTITANQILIYIRGLINAKGSSLESLYRIINEQAEAIIFKADKDTKSLNIPIRDLKLGSGVIIAAILRDNELIIPRGDEVIKCGGRIIVITKNFDLKNINEIFERGYNR